MPTPTFQSLEGTPSTQQIQDYIVKLVRDLNFMLENLDELNVSRLNARVIVASTITANKLNVTQLSAIAADLGTITAGTIYGTYIATANGTYPRIEFSNTDNLLKAYYDASTYISVNPGLGGLLDPLIEFHSTSTTSQIGNIHVFGDAFLLSSNQDVVVQSTANDVSLSASSGNVSATSAAGTITDLVTSINSLNASITSLNSSVSTLNSTVAGKANAFTGLTGNVVVQYNVDFTAQTVSTSTLTFTNGVLTSIA